MKYFWILFFVIISKQYAFGQTDTLHLYQSYHSFSNQEKAEWTAFKNNWNYVEYEVLKQKHNIKKLNCKNCENYYADIYIELNAEGELISAKFKNGKMCGVAILNENLIKEFENSLKTRTFKFLKNKAFIARFGNILKC